MSMLRRIGNRLRRLPMTVLWDSTFRSRSDLPWCSLQPTTLVDALVETIRPRLLSAAHPGQDGVGHFNEQSPSYWIRKLAERGFDYDDALTKRITMNWQWYPENVMFFRKPV